MFVLTEIPILLVVFVVLNNCIFWLLFVKLFWCICVAFPLVLFFIFVNSNYQSCFRVLFRMLRLAKRENRAPQQGTSHVDYIGDPGLLVWQYVACCLFQTCTAQEFSFQEEYGYQPFETTKNKIAMNTIKQKNNQILICTKLRFLVCNIER